MFIDLKTNVTATYNAANILLYAGSQISSTNFDGCTFLITLSSSATMNRASLGYINFNGGYTGSNVVILAHPGAIYPSLGITSGGLVYVFWAGDPSASGAVYASVMRVR